MKLRVHIYQPVEESFLAELYPLLESGIDLTRGEKLPERRDYQILVAGRVEEQFVTASPGLEAVIIPWAGLPLSTRDLLRNHPHIAIHNLHHNAAPTAELAISLMLAAAKRLVPADRAFRGHDWSLRYAEREAIVLEGKTALILGYGAIGRRIARTCESMGMKVRALRRQKRNDDPGYVTEQTADSLASALSVAQVLFVSVPLTDETRGLIGGRELALLPKGAIVVNISRGAVIEEEALFEACKAGRVRAGLDVWYQYPQDEAARANTRPSDFPFHELDNVVMTPHLGGNSDRDDKARARDLARLLNSRLKCETMPNRVDLARGY